MKLLTRDSIQYDFFSKPWYHVRKYSHLNFVPRGKTGFVTNRVEIDRFFSEPSSCDTLCYFFINKNLVFFTMAIQPSNLLHAQWLINVAR